MIGSFEDCIEIKVNVYFETLKPTNPGAPTEMNIRDVFFVDKHGNEFDERSIYDYLFETFGDSWEAFAWDKIAEIEINDRDPDTD